MARRQKTHIPEVSVVIVNYNVCDFLKQALISLKKSLHGIPSEIVVVDNASDDGSVAMLQEHFPDVHVIAEKENLGFAKANNIALSQCQGEWIVLLNPDTVVQEDTVRVLQRFMEEHADAGMVGCKILNPDGSFQPACRRSFPTPWVAFTRITYLSRLFPHSRIFGRYNLMYLNPEETYPVEAISGSCMMLRRSVYEQIGGLDEQYFMYGEDLDWCFRIRQAGWQIYYVPTTQIIHYKGESMRRSNIDEIKTFYEAMRFFVQKHYASSFLALFALQGAIVLVSWIASGRALLRTMRVALMDVLVITVSTMLAEYLWKGAFFRYPPYAVPFVLLVPPVVIVLYLYAAGVYTHRRRVIARSFVSVVVSYILISAAVAFFRAFAFSRMMILIAAVISAVLVPGWRILYRVFRKLFSRQGHGLFSKPTLVVGTGPDAKALVKKIRTRVADGYEIIGWIGETPDPIGSTIADLPVLGSIENIGKVIRQRHISDVIFAPESLNYSQILSVLARTGIASVNFHLVPHTMEVMIGKSSIDHLNDLPLVQLQWNLDLPFHRVAKRLFDILISGLLLCTVYPILYQLPRAMGKKRTGLLADLPKVFSGAWSMVGPVASAEQPALKDGRSYSSEKPGISGLVQLQHGHALNAQEKEEYDLYYAKNQSLFLDIEILIKTWMKRRTLFR